MNTSISLRTGSMFIVLVAALLAGTVAFAGGDEPARTAGPRNTIVTPVKAPVPEAQLAALEVDPADLDSIARRLATKCGTYRAGPRGTIPTCR